MLSGDHHDTVKLHDVVRQIMASIAIEDNSMYCFENFRTFKSCLNKRELPESTAILLPGHDFDQLPDDLACPRLELLLTSDKNQ